MNTTCLPKRIMSIHECIMYLDLFYEVIQKTKSECNFTLSPPSNEVYYSIS